MRIHRSVFTVVVLTSSVIGQNTLEIFPGNAGFPTRGSVANNPHGGELFQNFPAAHFRNILDDGSAAPGWHNGFIVLLQDQNGATQEQYDVVYRRGTDAGGPVSGAAGLITRKGPFTSPPCSGPVCAWRITNNWGAAPVNTRECDKALFVGVAFRQPPGAGWTADGLSVHSARGDGGWATSLHCADTATVANDHAWEIVASGGNGTNTGVGPVTHPVGHLSWRFAIFGIEPTLQIGTGVDRYGQGGFNALQGSRSCGLRARARYGSSYLFGSSILAMSLSRLPGCGVSIFPRTRLCLDPSSLIFLGCAGINFGGYADHVLYNSSVPTGIMRTIHFQAVGSRSRCGSTAVAPRLTNGASTNFNR